MKKIISGIIMLAVITSMVFTVGCTLNQMKSIAKDAGKYSMIAWISFDNPSVATKKTMTDVITFIKTKTDQIEADQTFTEAFYADVCALIDANNDISEIIKPMVKAGGLVVLNGIDLFLIENPKWVKNIDDAVTLANSFCDGAISSLELPESNTVIMQARKSAKLRSKLLKD